MNRILLVALLAVLAASFRVQKLQTIVGECCSSC